MRNSAAIRIEALLIPLASLAAVLGSQWRYGFNWGDEGWLWYISQRTTLGEVPIRDVFSYDPGRYYWSAVVFRVLGSSGFLEQLIANYLFALLGLTILYFVAARCGIHRRWRICLVLLLAVCFGFPRHKTYEQALSLISAAGITSILFAPESRRMWFAYGVASGIAAFFGRNSGLYFVLAALLVFAFVRIRSHAPTFKTFSALFPGIVLGYSPVFFMIIRFRGFASAFIDSVLLTPKWSWPLRIPFPWHAHAGHGLNALQVRSVAWLCIAVPAVYLFLLCRGLRTKAFDARTMLATGATVAGVPYLHHAFYHADFFHIAQGVLPFIVASVALTQILWDSGRKPASIAWLSGFAALVLGSWLPMEPLVQYVSARAHAPESITAMEIDSRVFLIPTDEALVMSTVKRVFQDHQVKDGGFLEAPFYPGIYAFLSTKAPFWDTYYLWPRNDEVQQRHIKALLTNNTSVVLLNRDASFDKQDWLKIDKTYPRLVSFILGHYAKRTQALPDGFELYCLPESSCSTK